MFFTFEVYEPRRCGDTGKIRVLCFLCPPSSLSDTVHSVCKWCESSRRIRTIWETLFKEWKQGQKYQWNQTKMWRKSYKIWWNSPQKTLKRTFAFTESYWTKQKGMRCLKSNGRLEAKGRWIGEKFSIAQRTVWTYQNKWARICSTN